MIRAEQQQVIHNANVAIIGLRSQEIAYFNVFFVSFGTQSAVVAGCLVNGMIRMSCIISFIMFISPRTFLQDLFNSKMFETLLEYSDRPNANSVTSTKWNTFRLHILGIHRFRTDHSIILYYMFLVYYSIRIWLEFVSIPQIHFICLRSIISIYLNKLYAYFKYLC